MSDDEIRALRDHHVATRGNVAIVNLADEALRRGDAIRELEKEQMEDAKHVGRMHVRIGDLEEVLRQGADLISHGAPNEHFHEWEAKARAVLGEKP